MDEWFEPKMRSKLRVLASKIENTKNLVNKDATEAKEEAIAYTASQITESVKAELKNTKRDYLIQGVGWGLLSAVAIAIWLNAML